MRAPLDAINPISVWTVTAAGPAVLTGVAYYVGAKIAFAMGTLSLSFAPFWPPNTVLLCAFLLVPPHRWPLYVGIAFPAHVLAELEGGMQVPQLLLAFANNCALTVISAALLRRMAAGPPWLGTLRNAAAYLIVACVLCPAVIAIVAAWEPILAGADMGDYWAFWMRWYLSNVLGALTLSPAFLVWIGESAESKAPATIARYIEAAALSVGLIATGMVALDSSRAIAGNALPSLLYLPVSMLLWAAIRFGRKGTSAAIFGMTLISIWHAMNGRGPFVHDSPEDSVLGLQLFLVAASAPLIIVAALVEELSGANERMSRILASIGDCYVTMDRKWRITGINPQAASWLRMPHRHALNRVAPSEFGSRDLREALDSGIAAHIEKPSEIRPGRWLELHAYPSSEGLAVFFRDITRRKSIERAARENTALFHATMDALSARVVVLDDCGTIIAANAAGLRALPGSNSPEFRPRLGDDYSKWLGMLCAGTDLSRIGAGLYATISGDRSEFREQYAVARSGSNSWFQVLARRFTCEGRVHVVVACEDITELKQASEALRTLAGRVLRAQDDERQRIARDLHDSTCQNLLAASLNLDRLKGFVTVGGRSVLQETREMIELSMGELRTLSYVLHPPLLEDCGLSAALREYVRGFAKRTGIRVAVELPGDLGRLAPAIENALFRVVQESLTNVHRHSGSSVARVRLYRAGGCIVLSVADRGRGIGMARSDGAEGAVSLGVGIPGMRARLRQFDGGLIVRSGRWGTIVRAHVPIECESGTPSLETGETGQVGRDRSGG